MNYDLLPVFARNEAANKWLEEHPLVLGGGAIALGIVLTLLGVNALKTGKATTKWGQEVEGGSAKAMGVVWLVVGVGAILFGLYKIIAGFR
ncbi:MAG: hypothetical protein NT069_33615 [Planctomycetota bacterium]|nr:hypothetical protein [Planctomycetota bacterium]